MIVVDQTIQCHYDTGAGKVHSGDYIEVGFNLGKVGPSNNAHMFTNALKNSSWTEEAGQEPVLVGLDSNGYCTGMTSGSYDFLIATSYWPTGNWTLRWSGTCDAILDGGTKTGGTKTGDVNGWERVYNVTSTATGGSIRVRFSGGSLTNTIVPALIPPGEVTNYDAGKVLHSQIISDVAGSTVARTMDWQEVNYSPVVDYADLGSFDDISWRTSNTNLGVLSNKILRGVPIKAMCMAMNELDVDWWYCVHHQMTDACKASVFSEMDTELSTAWKNTHKLYVEESNEATFNFEQEKWYQTIDQPLITPSYNSSTDIFTSTAHGLAHGDRINTFSSPDYWVQTLSDGVTRYVYVHDANTFSLSRGGVAAALGDAGTQAEILVISTATQANPVEITVEQDLPATIDTGDRINIRGVTTGMTGLNGLTRQVITKTASNKFTIPFDSSLESPATADHGYIHLHEEFVGVPGGSPEIRMKHNLLASQIINNAKEAVNTWSIADTNAPNINIIHMAGCHNENGWNVEQAAQFAPGWLEALDFISWAPYFDFKNYTIALGNAFDWWADLDASTTLWLQQNNNQQSFENRRSAEAVGRYCMWAYECGDHNGPQSSDPQKSAMITFARSDNSTDVHLQYCKNLRQQGYLGMVYYHSHGDYSSSVWGAMEYPGHTTAKSYLGLKPYLDAGGAPSF
jgi:hypothetical protein